MDATTEKIRSVIRHLLLEGVELNITSVQDMLKGDGIAVQDEQIAPVLDEEGGPLPAYRGVE